VIIIISYCSVLFEKARDYTPALIFPNEGTNLLQ
jgi:aspartate 1-decarboxylase